MNEDDQFDIAYQVELCKRHAVTIVSRLMDFVYKLPNLEDIDKELKHIEGSISKARHIIKDEIKGREINRRRQINRLKEQQE
jgi:hypothetical protein